MHSQFASQRDYHNHNISGSSSGNNLEVDFVVRNVFNKVNEIENKYNEKNKYQPPVQAQLKSFQSQPAGQIQYRATSPTIDVNKRDLRYLEDNTTKKKDNSPILNTADKKQKHVLTMIFNEICQSLDTAQTHCIQLLSLKQNEVFQIATKHKVPNTFRNEVTGEWYEAKSQVAQAFEDIKDRLFYQQQQAETQLSVSQIYQQDSKESNKFKLTTEIKNFDQFSQKSLKQIQKLQSSIEQNNEALFNEKLKLKVLIDELSVLADDKQTTRMASERYLSPFQKKIQNQFTSVSSLGVLNSQKRPSSSQKTSAAKSTRIKPSGYDRQPATQAQFQVQQQTNERGLNTIVNQMRALFDQIQLQENQQSKGNFDLFQIVQNVLHQNQLYIQKIDKYQKVNPQQESQLKKVLEFNNEQLEAELRLCTEKFQDLKVENTKLREQIVKHKPSKDESEYKRISFDLCNLVTQFMDSMRQLQKAVNKKTPDVNEQKNNFESSKMELQSLVHSVKEFINNQEPIKVPSLQSAPIRSQSKEKKPTVSSSQLNKLPALLQNVKNLQLEKQKLQELIAELKQVHQIELEKKDKKIKVKSDQLHKFAAQCQALMIKQISNDQFMVELKQQILKQQSVFELIYKLEQSHNERAQQDLQKVLPNFKLDPQITALKQELSYQIASRSLDIESKVEGLVQQLKVKEESLARLKLLFIEKLHELENSFADITATVEEVDFQQQQQAQQKREYQTSHMEQAVETVLAKFEQDDREKEIEQLIQVNQDLTKYNEDLSKKIGEVKVSGDQEAQIEFVIELQDQVDNLKQEMQKQLTVRKEYEIQEQILKKEIQTLKYDNKRAQFDLKDGKERFDKLKSEYEAQFKALKFSINHMQQQTTTLKSQLDSEVGQKQQLEQKLSVIQKDLSLAGKAFDELDNQKVNAENELQQIKQEMLDMQDNFDTERDYLHSRIEQLDQQIESHELKQQKQDLYDELESVKSELQQTVLELEQVQGVYQQLQQVNQKCESDLQYQTQSVSELNEQVLKLNLKVQSQDSPDVIHQLLDNHMKGLQEQKPLNFKELPLNIVYKLLSATQNQCILKQEQIIQLNENLTETQQQMKELKNELQVIAQESLESQINNNKYQFDHNDITQQQLDLNQVNAKLEFKQKELDCLSTKFELVNQELASVLLNFDKASKDLIELKRKNDKSEQQNKVLSAKIESNKQEQEKYEIMIRTCEQERYQEKAELQRQVEELEELVSNTKDQLQSKEVKLQFQNEQFKLFEQELENSQEQLQTQIQDYESQINSQKDIETELQNELQTLNSSSEAKQIQIQQLELQLQEQILVSEQKQKESDVSHQSYQEKISQSEQLLTQNQQQTQQLKQEFEIQLENYSKQINASQQQNQQLTEQVTLMQNELQQNTQVIQDSNEQFQLLQNAKVEQQIEFEKLQQQQTCLSDELSLERQSLTKAGLQIKLLICLHTKVRCQFMSKLQTLQNELQDLQSELKQLNSQLKSNQLLNNQLEETVQTQRSANTKLDKELAQLNQQILKLQQDYKEISIEVQSVKQQNIEQLEQISSQQQELNNSEVQLLQLQNNQVQKQISDKDLQKQFESLNEQLQQLLTQNQSIKHDNDQLKLQLQASNNQNQKLNVDIDQIRKQSELDQKQHTDKVNKLISESAQVKQQLFDENENHLKKLVSQNELAKQQLIKDHLSQKEQQNAENEQEKKQLVAENQLSQNKLIQANEQIKDKLIQENMKIQKQLVDQNEQVQQKLIQESDKVKQLSLQVQNDKLLNEQLLLIKQELDISKSTIQTLNQQITKLKEQIIDSKLQIKDKIDLADQLNSKCDKIKEMNMQFVERVRQLQEQSKQQQSEILQQQQTQKLQLEELETKHNQQLQQLNDQNQQLLKDLQVQKSNDDKDIKDKDDLKVKLAIGLHQHLKQLLQSKIQSISYECENLQIFTQTLEQNASNSEFRQVQLEGDLKTQSEQIDELQEELRQIQSEKDAQIDALDVEVQQLNEKLEQQEQISETIQNQLTQVQRDLVQALTQLNKHESNQEQVEDYTLAKIQELQLEINQYIEQIGQLKSENKKLKAEPKTESGRNSWGSDGGRGSWGSGGPSTSQEVEEHLKHIRSIMIQFLSKLPFTTKENEDILPILFSMLSFSDQEVSQVQQAREVLNKQISAQNVQTKTKSGISGFFNTKKK